ncbi:MAG: TetR/AcrR family transcriptional regulator [Lachnospiraceae bacterium]|nr:TetR/AcrR family transcriptional regulator [Lachnospiraceae bacterium]
MGKIDLNKKQKHDSLLDAAFQLFIKNGFDKTSISDIAETAGVAKGTFYLYFKNKFDIRDRLISHKASQVFQRAYDALKLSSVTSFEDQMLFMTDHILNQFEHDKNLVLFLSKHLSWGFFKDTLVRSELDNSLNIQEIFEILLKKADYIYHDPEIMMCLILELISGTSYQAILYSEPFSLDQLKPHLYKGIRAILKEFRVTDPDSSVQTQNV